MRRAPLARPNRLQTGRALKRAIEHVGSSAELARRCGVTRAAVQGWKERGFVQAERAVQIETVCNGAVTRSELRPDLFLAVKGVTAESSRSRGAKAGNGRA